MRRYLKRTAWTEPEDRDLLEFLIRELKSSNPIRRRQAESCSGNGIWTAYLKANPDVERTVYSVQTRFRRHLWTNENFPYITLVPPEELLFLVKNLKQTVTKAQRRWLERRFKCKIELDSEDLVKSYKWNDGKPDHDVVDGGKRQRISTSPVPQKTSPRKKRVHTLSDSSDQESDRRQHNDKDKKSPKKRTQRKKVPVNLDESDQDTSKLHPGPVDGSDNNVSPRCKKNRIVQSDPIVPRRTWPPSKDEAQEKGSTQNSENADDILPANKNKGEKQMREAPEKSIWDLDDSNDLDFLGNTIAETSSPSTSRGVPTNGKRTIHIENRNDVKTASNGVQWREKQQSLMIDEDDSDPSDVFQGIDVLPLTDDEKEEEQEPMTEAPPEDWTQPSVLLKLQRGYTDNQNENAEAMPIKKLQISSEIPPKMVSEDWTQPAILKSVQRNQIDGPRENAKDPTKKGCQNVEVIRKALSDEEPQPQVLTRLQRIQAANSPIINSATKTAGKKSKPIDETSMRKELSIVMEKAQEQQQFEKTDLFRTGYSKTLELLKKVLPEIHEKEWKLSIKQESRDFIVDLVRWSGKRAPKVVLDKWSAEIATAEEKSFNDATSYDFYLSEMTHLILDVITKAAIYA